VRSALRFLVRVVALVVAVIVALVVASLVAAGIKDPFTGGVLLLTVALLGGLLFFAWLVLRLFAVLLRGLGSHANRTPRGLGAEYEQMILAQRKAGRRWRLRNRDKP
jgi:hypothetical protein